MKILFIAPWLPWPPHDGARIRIWETLRFLAPHHRVTFLTHRPETESAWDEKPVRDLCERVETAVLPVRSAAVLGRLAQGLGRGLPLIQAFHWQPQLARRIRQLTAVEDYDIVHIEFSYAGHYVRAVNPASRARTVLSMHNVESIRFARELQVAPWSGRRLGLMWDHYLRRQWEPKSLRRFDGILATSELERQWIERHAPEAVVALAPNGVDVQRIHAVEPPKESRSIVFTGLMNYPPNVDAVVWFCQDIWPLLRQHLPQLRLNIVGRLPHLRVMELNRQPGVCVTGEVPDVRPYVEEALALVVPLRSGGGTRLKILEAMAMGRPVVSTSLGAEGLEIVAGENILLAETAEQFLRQLQTLIDHPDRARQLGQAGRHLVVTQYDWPICLRGLTGLYETLMSRAKL
jgi:sugar transferase (PEP-CTERM/EpsH1 system associated)